MSDEGRLLAGRYRVGETIGRGGMSTVHVGEDTRLGRTVAIKLLKPSLAVNPAFRARFRQEAQAASRMSHPTIVRVFDAGEETITDDEGRSVQLPFIVMEHVDGRLLKDIIAEGPLEPGQATTIIDGVLTALEYAHRAGVVHRDVKPGNVMVTDSGDVKVMDFGIARAISESSPTVAQTTAILGTAAYFSPEQARGESIDARTDLYSTGVLLFELLSGRQPFRAATPIAVAYQHVSEEPVPPSTINPSVSPAFDAVVMHAMSKNRDERFQTAAEFRADVQTAASGKVPIRRVPDESEMIFGAPTEKLTPQELQLRQLTEDDSMPRTQRRPPVVWIWSAIIAVFVIVLAVMYWAFNLQATDDLPNNAREIPVLTGLTLEQAELQLQDLGLPVLPLEEPSADVEVDHVTRSDPAAGEIVEPGTQVRVYVSTGRIPVAFPNLIDRPLSEAQKTVTDLGLVNGTVMKQNSATVPADMVLSTNPAGDVELPVGTEIDFVVSSGLVTIIDLTGLPLDDATAYLTGPDVQLNPIPAEDLECAAVEGSPITGQSLAPGDVPQKSDITLTYCAG